MNRYKTKEIVCFTNFSKVEIVEDEKTGNELIKKTMLKTEDPVLRHQYLQEIEILSRLRGVYYPHLIDVIEEQNTLAIIEEKIEGQPLETWLEKNPAYKTRIRFLLELLDAIDSFHQTGYLYIDWKPSNVLILNGSPVLIDFNGCIPSKTSSIYVFSQELPSQSKALKSIKDDLAYASPLFYQIVQRSWIKKQFTSTNAIRKRYKQRRNKRKILALFLLLSVLFFGLCQFQPRNLIDQYIAQGRPLYHWIEEGKLERSLLEEKEQNYFTNEVIRTKDPLLCRYWLEKIDTHSIDAQNVLYLKWQAGKDEDFEPSELFLLLKELGQEDDLIRLIEICIEHQIVLSIDQQKELAQKIEVHDRAIKRYIQLILLYASMEKETYLPDAFDRIQTMDEEGRELIDLCDQLQLFTSEFA